MFSITRKYFSSAHSSRSVRDKIANEQRITDYGSTEDKKSNIFLNLRGIVHHFKLEGGENTIIQGREVSLCGGHTNPHA
jgi:hypothetical protein